MKLNANIYIGDDRVDIADYAISINRNWSLCNCLQTFSIVLDPKVKDYLNSFDLTLKPSLDIEIREHGVKVFTGFLTTLKMSRKPEPLIEIQGADKFKYAKDYFLDEDFGKTNGETVAYWVSQLLELCGLSYSIDSSDANSMTVAPGIEISMRTVEDALQELLSYSSSYIYTSPGGTVHISNGARNSNIKFKSGITSVYNDLDPTIIEGGNVKRAFHQVNDTNTRDVVKVWGWKGSSAFLNAHESPFLTAERSVDLHLPVSKTVLYASNYIQTQDVAESLAQRIISEVGKFDSIKTVECIGNPDIQIGQKVDIDVDLESEHLVGSAKITTVSSNMGQDGYIMNVKMDEFCPKFAAWSVATPPAIFYAGTNGQGVYKSLDGGVTWFEYNSGLTSGRKVVKMLAATAEDEVMAIINGSLWYITTSGLTTSGTWTRRYLPTPFNEAGDIIPPTAGSPIAVDSPGTPNEFNVLSTYKGGTGMVPVLVSGVYVPDPFYYRSWEFNTIDTGYVWTNTQISKTTESGIDYDFSGMDLSSRYSTPFVLCGKGQEDYPGLVAVRFPLNQVIWRGSDMGIWIGGGKQDGTYNEVDNPSDGFYFGIQDWDFTRDINGKPFVNRSGTAPNRVVSFTIVGRDISGWPPAQPNYVPSRYINYFVQSGSVILITYATLPTYQVTKKYVPNNQAYFGSGYYLYPISIYEKDFGNDFYLNFSFYTEYPVINPESTVADYFFKVYSGEPKFVPTQDIFPYPYTKWPHFENGGMTLDQYPLTLGAGTIKVSLDDLWEIY